MTPPARAEQLPYLHIDDLSFHVPADTDLATLTRQLLAAAATNQVVTVPVVDEAGQTVHALVSPARARLIATSRAKILAVRKSNPGST